MPPIFPSDLPARTAWGQAGAALVLFYGLVYGGGFLLGGDRGPVVEAMLSALLLGTFMLLAVGLCLRGEASWRDALGMAPQPVGATLGWGLLGVGGAYTANLILSAGYLTLHGDLVGVAEGRVSWLGTLAELPLWTILPLALFAAVWEEVVFRGFLLGRVRAALSSRDTPGATWPRDGLAVGLTAICFGAGHGYQGALGLLQTTGAGLALGVLAIWRKSLWPAIAAHLMIDVLGFLALKALQPLMHTLGNPPAVS